MSTLIPLFEIALIGVPLLLALLRTLPQLERPRMARLSFVGFGLRLAVAVLFDLVPGARLFHEDADGYERFGAALAASWWGEGPPVPLPETNPGFLAICGSLYYVFGRYRMVVTAFTSLCGTLTIFFVYRLALRSFHPVVARRAALLTAYFPSMVLWSAMALKDPVMILLVVVALDAALVL